MTVTPLSITLLLPFETLICACLLMAAFHTALSYRTLRVSWAFNLQLF
jgi:hypothetical protein